MSVFPQYRVNIHRATLTRAHACAKPSRNSRSPPAEIAQLCHPCDQYGYRAWGFTTRRKIISVQKEHRDEKTHLARRHIRTARMDTSTTALRLPSRVRPSRDQTITTAGASRVSRVALKHTARAISPLRKRIS